MLISPLSKIPLHQLRQLGDIRCDPPPHLHPMIWRWAEFGGPNGPAALVMGMFLLAEEYIAFFRRRPRRLVYHRLDS